MWIYDFHQFKIFDRKIFATSYKLIYLVFNITYLPFPSPRFVIIFTSVSYTVTTCIILSKHVRISTFFAMFNWAGINTVCTCNNRFAFILTRVRQHNLTLSHAFERLVSHRQTIDFIRGKSCVNRFRFWVCMYSQAPFSVINNLLTQCCELYCFGSLPKCF